MATPKLPKTDEAPQDAEARRPELDRRQTQLAVAKFAAFVAPVSLVLLDADAAKAKQPCSTHPNPMPGTNCD